MKKEEFLEKLKEVENIEVYENEPMSRHTTFKVGGEAAFLAEVADLHGIRHTIDAAIKCGIRYFIMGNGSNLLISDKGFDGVIIKIAGKLGKIHVDGDIVTAQAGAPLSEVVRVAAGSSLSGLEFAAGIPGTVGGAVVMNAGAFEGEMSKVVDSVLVYDIDKRECVNYSCEDMKFEYRHTALSGKRAVVLKAEFKLDKGEIHEIKWRIEEINAARREKQPLEYPSAGSTFKRPIGFYAGTLIDRCGLRGARIGGAMVSEKHAGFIVNAGEATAEDVYNLIQHVRDTVKGKTGIYLEPEVITLGDFE